MSKNPTLSEIKKKIEEAKRDDPNLTELDLSDIAISNFTSELNQPIQKLKDLQVLYLSGCGLKTLEGFPKCKFSALDLSNNQLDDSSKFQVLTNYPELSQVIASDNKISKLETIYKLQTLENLIEIDFENNPVASAADYRKSVFEKFPDIQLVDRIDRDGNKVEDEEQDLDQGDDDDFDDDEDEDQDEDGEEDFDDDEDEDQESDPKKKKGANPKKK